jgi:hypothetical protein
MWAGFSGSAAICLVWKLFFPEFGEDGSKFFEYIYNQF